MARLGTDDRHLAHLALRTTLHALRDRLRVDNAVDLGAQLPMLVRGFYYEGWRPAGTPVKEHSREAFLERIRAESHAPDFAPETGSAGDARSARRPQHRGEIEDVKSMRPKLIRELWPA